LRKLLIQPQQSGYFCTGEEYPCSAGKYQEEWNLRPIDRESADKQTPNNNRKWFGPCRAISWVLFCRSRARQGGRTGWASFGLLVTLHPPRPSGRSPTGRSFFLVHRFQSQVPGQVRKRRAWKIGSACSGLRPGCLVYEVMEVGRIKQQCRRWMSRTELFGGKGHDGAE